jgi:hypothetical protein
LERTNRQRMLCGRLGVKEKKSVARGCGWHTTGNTHRSSAANIASSAASRAAGTASNTLSASPTSVGDWRGGDVRGCVSVLVDGWQFAMCEGALSEVQPTMWKHTSLLPRIVQSSCWPCRGWLCTQRTCGRVCRGLKQPPQTVHGGSPSKILGFGGWNQETLGSKVKSTV